jgi:very-short-patch-repair endonuclease
MPRPHLYSDIADLEALVEGASATVLYEIRDELEFRTTLRARTLREHVDRILLHSEEYVVNDEIQDDTIGINDDIVASHLPEDDPRAQYAKEQIANLRTRLLDLTARNPLLNYRFSERARGQVRVIDELPDQLFAYLNGSKTMWFKPLDVPVEEPKDEHSDDFQISLDVARLDDQSYLDALNELGEENPEDPRFYRIERELKDRVRESLGLPPRPDRDTMSKADIARHQGLDPNYTLPDHDGGQRHNDNEIQTLLFPDEMERKLSHLQAQTRRGHEEMGLNTLFAAYGYLEWYEHDHSDRKLLSPLLLQPLEITRETIENSYRYGISGTGEEAEVNLTLIERMKEFGLAVPELEEDEAPESYLAKVAQAIERKNRWQVRRFVSIGTFSFGKLVMWHDLDPDRWPEGHSLAAHPVVADLLAGTGEAGGVDAEEYPVDAHDFETRLPMLITDADASQLSAIIDAVEGKNLAINGPPGTGKSQTITNLIAAALARNKSVLFVAEKMAALEVVKNRLDHFGLGDFVLELHSTKARKKDVLGSISARLELGHEQPPEQLAGAGEELKRLKRDLTAYVDLLNIKVGRSGKILQEVFWAEARTRLVELPKELDQVTFANAEDLNVEDLKRCRDAMATLEKSWKEVTLDCDKLSNHPWYGVRKILPVFEQETLIEDLSDWRDALIGTEQLANHVGDIYGLCHESSEADLKRFSEHILSMPHPDDAAVRDRNIELLNKFEDATIFERAPELHKHWTRLDEIDCLLGEIFEDPAKAIEDPTRIDELLHLVVEAGATNLRPRDVETKLAESRDQLAAWEIVQDALSRLAQSAKVNSLDKYPDLRLFTRAIELVRNTPRKTFARRRNEFLEPDAEQTMQFAKRMAHTLLEQREKISGFVNVEPELDPQELRTAATELTSTNFFARPFSSTYKKAKKLFISVAKGKGLDREKAAGWLRLLADLLEGMSLLAQNVESNEIMGEWFIGIDTNFEALEDARDYCIAAHAFGHEEGIGLGLRRTLLEMAPADLNDLVDRASGTNGRLLEEAISTLKQNSGDTVSTLATRLKESIDRWTQLETSSIKIKLKPLSALKQLPDIRQILCERSQILGSELLSLAEIIEQLENVGFTRNVPDKRKAVLDLVESLLPPNNLINSSRWRALMFATDLDINLKAVHGARAEISISLEALDRHRTKVTKLSNWDTEAVFETTELPETESAKILEWINHALSRPSALAAWISWLRCRADAVDEGLLQLVEVFEIQGFLKQLPLAFDRVVWRSLIRQVFSDHPELERFSGIKQETARKRFRELDRQILELNSQKLRADLIDAHVSPGVASGRRNEWTDLALLRHHSTLQRPRIPIRKLIAGGHKALKELKPCWMMSPSSIAQFLTQGEIEFDLVVVDEASQMKPEDAISGSGRGRQLVVVGDPMQLPPTSFFDRNDGFDSEDEEDVEAESILDLALSVFQPVRNLTWHYRSRHESLIAFSNKEFYDGNLVVFPSPSDVGDELGVKFHKVDGRYQGRGGNRDEVISVAEAAVMHMRNNRNQSLGVVAVNREQAELIRSEVERLVLQDEAAQEYIAEWDSSIESFFVKNLETVQGDERDVIMISTVYGPNEQGAMHQRFGPINSAVGHRRLNVLFTRAKRRVDLFSSMTSADVRPGDNANWGVFALKRYLEYAATGRLETGDEGGGAPDSDFEIFVADALKSKGYQVHTQVGVAGFRIDLGVKHPAYPHGYLLGIECDGATYHSAKSARDRDALRQEILEILGWKLYRIWSTDWFGDPRGETDKLIRHLDNLRTTNPIVATQNIEANSENSNETSTLDSNRRQTPQEEFFESPSGPSARDSNRRQTPQKDFRRPLIALLAERGGEMQRPRALKELEAKLADKLTDYDKSDINSGTVRWEKSAEWEVRAMREQGILKPVSDTLRGVWALTDYGWEVANKQQK